MVQNNSGFVKMSHMIYYILFYIVIIYIDGLPPYEGLVLMISTKYVLQFSRCIIPRPLLTLHLMYILNWNTHWYFRTKIKVIVVKIKKRILICNLMENLAQRSCVYQKREYYFNIHWNRLKSTRRSKITITDIWNNR